ncbi:MAG: hypothetical protein RSE52_06345 [Erysipelotrichaceae bacterium]
MKKYKDELDHIQLSEEDKKNLFTYISNQKEPKQRSIPFFKYAIGIACIFAFLFFVSTNLISKDKDIKVKEVVYQQLYEPQWYQSFGGMGSSSKCENTNEFIQLNKDNLHPINKTYTFKDHLPVYEYERYYDQHGVYEPYEDAFYINQLKPYAAALKIEEEPSKVNQSFEIKNEAYHLKSKVNGDIEILGTTLKKGNFDDHPDLLLKEAKAFFSKIKATTKIDKPNYRIEMAANHYYVSIYETKDSLYYEPNQAITFQLNYVSDQEYQPCMILPDVDHHQVKVKDFPIMPLDEAVKTLLQGGYTSINYPKEALTKKDIIRWEYLYTDSSFINYLPYRIPIYRFYIEKKDELYYLDVVAIKKDALKQLNKVTWLQKK